MSPNTTTQEHHGLDVGWVPSFQNKGEPTDQDDQVDLWWVSLCLTHPTELEPESVSSNQYSSPYKRRQQCEACHNELDSPISLILLQLLVLHRGVAVFV
jgi:hypothetical protein